MKTTNVTTASGRSVSGKAITRALIFAGLIFSALFAVSNPLPVTNPASAESKKTIREYFKFPQILATRVESKHVSNNTVEVLFTTDETGHVNFALAKTQSGELKKEVEKQFYKLYLPKLKQDVVHSVVLNFKTL
jgi:hypothetical protein